MTVGCGFKANKASVLQIPLLSVCFLSQVSEEPSGCSFYLVVFIYFTVHDADSCKKKKIEEKQKGQFLQQLVSESYFESMSEDQSLVGHQQ